MSRRKKSSNRSKIVIIVFFAILLIFSATLISSRNKLVDINSKDVDYIEIISNKTNNMKNIKDKKDVEKIVKKLNKLRGKQANKDTSGEIISYVNVYFVSGNKISFVKTGLTLRVNDIYYNLSGGNSKTFDNIVEEFTK